MDYMSSACGQVFECRRTKEMKPVIRRSRHGYMIYQIWQLLIGIRKECKDFCNTRNVLDVVEHVISIKGNHIIPQLPSGNQTWQWQIPIDELQLISPYFPNQTPICRGLPEIVFQPRSSHISRKTIEGLL